METATMDAAFRATQADYDEGYNDGHREGYEAGYDAGQLDAERTTDEALEAEFSKGYDEGKADAERDQLTYSDYWGVAVDEALDILVRHFDGADPAVSAALRDVMRDYNHPSRIWDAPPPEKRK